MGNVQTPALTRLSVLDVSQTLERVARDCNDETIDAARQAGREEWGAQGTRGAPAPAVQLAVSTASAGALAGPLVASRAGAPS